MYNENQIIKQRKTLLIVSVIVFVIFVVFVGVIWGMATGDKYNTDVVNEEALAENLSNKDLDRVKKELATVVRNYYDIEENVEIVSNVRSSTYKETTIGEGKNVTFTMDVETVKATYNVWLLKNSSSDIDIAFTCASMDETNYPDSFCIGTDYHSTIDVTIDDQLPYTGRVGNIIYSLSHTPYTADLEVYVNSCGDEEIIRQTREDVEKWISEQGYDAKMFPINIPADNCYDSMVGLN